MKKIIIAGANGFIARYLSRYFTERGWDVVGLARREQGMDKGCRYVHWDGKILGDWAAEIDGCDAVVNLAGRSVNCRYNAKNRSEIKNSRVDSTRVLGEAIAASDSPPEVWLNSSTATIYRHAEDYAQSENGEIGETFSAEIAKVWESTFFEAKVPEKVRKIALRTSMVMADEPGTVFHYLLNLAKYGLGGKIATGKQMVSWIHEEDVCRVIDWLIHNQEVEGCINMTSPETISNAEMMRRFRSKAGILFGLPATKWMAEIGAFFLRTEAELILKSRWVAPTRLLSKGFVFKHPEMKLEDW